MEPVRIRHWGLWPITKRTYLIGQTGVALTWLALLIIFLQLPSPLPRTPPDVQEAILFAWTLLHWIPTVLLVVAIWFVLDMWVVLWLFAKKEAAQKASNNPAQKT